MKTHEQLEMMIHIFNAFTVNAKKMNLLDIFNKEKKKTKPEEMASRLNSISASESMMKGYPYNTGTRFRSTDVNGWWWSSIGKMIGKKEINYYIGFKDNSFIFMVEDVTEEVKKPLFNISCADGKQSFELSEKLNKTVCIFVLKVLEQLTNYNDLQYENLCLHAALFLHYEHKL